MITDYNSIYIKIVYHLSNYQSIKRRNFKTRNTTSLKRLFKPNFILKSKLLLIKSVINVFFEKKANITICD